MNEGFWRLMAFSRLQDESVGEQLNEMRPRESMVEAAARHPVWLTRLQSFAERLAARRKHKPSPTRIRPTRGPRSLKPHFHF